MGRVFANGPEDLGSIPGHVIPKTFKIVFDTSLLNTQQYEVHIKGKVEQSRERSSTFPYTSMSMEKGAYWSPLTGGRQLYYKSKYISLTYLIFLIFIFEML